MLSGGLENQPLFLIPKHDVLSTEEGIADLGKKLVSLHFLPVSILVIGENHIISLYFLEYQFQTRNWLYLWWRSTFTFWMGTIVEDSILPAWGSTAPRLPCRHDGLYWPLVSTSILCFIIFFYKVIDCSYLLNCCWVMGAMKWPWHVWGLLSLWWLQLQTQAFQM